MFEMGENMTKKQQPILIIGIIIIIAAIIYFVTWVIQFIGLMVSIYYAKKNNLNIKSLKVREYKARWGSCSINGDISFNWRLIMAPPQIIEYVIIHELMHIKEHNHSSRFWDLVKSQYPCIKEAKQWLIYNGATLNV